jgi:hypothetical protein
LYSSNVCSCGCIARFAKRNFILLIKAEAEIVNFCESLQLPSSFRQQHTALTPGKREPSHQLYHLYRATTTTTVSKVQPQQQSNARAETEVQQQQQKPNCSSNNNEDAIVLQ